MRLGNMRAWHDGARHSKVFIVQEQPKDRPGWGGSTGSQEWNKNGTGNRLGLASLTSH